MPASEATRNRRSVHLQESERAERVSHASGAGHGVPASERVGGTGGAKPPGLKEGWEGWDEYAPFYDWENARTFGRRDVAFWRRLADERREPALELGCGTGRIAIPLLKTGHSIVGVDRSEAMLARARRRAERAGVLDRALFVRSDIRTLPLRTRRFDFVIAPYGMLQSLTRDRDLTLTLGSVARVLRAGGLFGIDLVPDLPRWSEYERKISLHGRRNATTTLTLVESVRQDRRRGLTIFDQEYIELRNGQRHIHRFSLTFRTLSVPQMVRRLERAGFWIRAVLGDYQGRAWDERADVWLILAQKR
jgi:ubiquinone/menaquinone biosynthesis C-methylase UbiE